MDFIHLTPSTRSPQRFTTKIDRYVAQPNDVLFSVRGTQLKASVMPEHPETFVAPSHLCILTPNDRERLLPEFLAIYLLSEPSQRYFHEKRRGSSVPLITKKSLGELPISIPSLETQARLIRLHQLLETEKDLQNRIHQLHELQVQQCFNKL